MRWRARVLGGRLREQWPVVGLVTGVAVVAAVLLGVLAGVVHLAQTQAVPASLARLDPQDVHLEATLWVNGEDSGTVLAKGRAGIARLTGDVPTDETTWQIGSLHALPDTPDAAPQIVYAAALPHSAARLVTGRWPQGATDASGAVEVNVPQVAAQAKGWQVGSRIEARPWDGDAYRAWVVVGTHEPAGSGAGWHRDRLGGRGTDTAFNVPGSAGWRTTVAWGPLVVDPAALAGPGQVDTTYLLVEPRLGEASTAALAHLREEVRNAPATLSEALEPEANGVVATTVGQALDATWREVVVVRAGVLAVGLLLAVLAATVLLLAARLLAERRAAGSELLAARGASPAHLRSLVVLEALTLAVGTFLVAPWVARAALVAMTRTGPLAAAGYHVPAGVPVPVVLACAATALVLAVALCVPAWHTVGSTSRAPHAGLLRAGADVALLVVGALTTVQLVAHGSPVTRGTGGLSVDGVLVAGPAVVTLAVATVAQRLVAPLARAGDVLAGRARSFGPALAAWQVARRPAVSAGTVLVVVVAVAAGSFGAAFGATWRTSQVEQVDLALGTDVRVVPVSDAPLTASTAVAAATTGRPGVHAQPVVDRWVGLGPRGNTSGASARLVALDATRPQDVRGRTGTPAADLLAGLPDAPAPAGRGADVPPGTRWIVLSGQLATSPATTGEGMVHVTVEDDLGVVTPLDARSVALGEPFAVALELPPAGALRVVAVGAVASPGDPPRSDPADLSSPAVRELGVDLRVTGIRAVPRAAGIATAKAAAAAPGAELTLRGAGWSGALHQPRNRAGATVTGDVVPGSELRVTSTMRADDGGTDPATLLARTWERPRSVPAVVSSAILDDLDVRVGMELVVDVAGTPVTAEVRRVVDHAPGAPRDAAVLVDRATLVRAALEAGGPGVAPDAWWVAAPAAAVPAVVQGLAGTDARVSTRAGLREEAVTGPVRVAVPAGLSLVTGAATLLVLVGTGAVAAAALRARRLELARLQAVGASRGGLVAAAVGESTSLVALGAAVGLLAGYGLAAVVAPLLTMSPDGRAPVPPPGLVWDAAAQALGAGAIVAGACAVVSLVVTLGVRRASGAALRMGDDG